VDLQFNTYEVSEKDIKIKIWRGGIEMAIMICPSCGGRGCLRCRDGLIDLEAPIKKATLPSSQRFEELFAQASSFEEFKVLLGNETDHRFANSYALDLWMQNQRR